MERVNVVGVEIHNLSLDEAVLAIEKLTLTREFSYTVTPNVDHLVKLQSDSSFKDAYRGADLIVCDGVPVLWAARFLGRPLRGRVNGTDLFEKLVERAAASGKSVFFLGGNEGVAAKAAKALQERHPDLRIAGYHFPPFGFEEDERENTRILALLNEARPTYLFVGVGSPKQELWISRYGPQTGATHAVGIGASFDFVAGVIPRAPVWMQRAGFEWLWRLSREPRRLWRRYLFNDPMFFWLVLKQRLYSN